MDGEKCLANSLPLGRQGFRESCELYADVAREIPGKSSGIYEIQKNSETYLIGIPMSGITRLSLKENQAIS